MRDERRRLWAVALGVVLGVPAVLDLLDVAGDLRMGTWFGLTAAWVWWQWRAWRQSST